VYTRLLTDFGLLADGVVKALLHNLNGRYYEVLYYFRKCSRSSMPMTKHIVEEKHFPASMCAALDAARDFPTEAHSLQLE
jgi:hypothetical protein